jgi:hypothetical protein
MSFGVNTIDSYKPIALPADPTANLHAATKQYVDSKTVTTGAYLPLAGGTMTGTITVPAAMDFIATKNGFGLYDNATGLVIRKGTTTIAAFGPTAITSTVPVVLPDDPTSGLQAATKQYVDSKTSGGSYTLPNASATVLGGIKIGNGLAIDSNGVCTASLAGNYVNKAGDVMNGPLRYAPNAGPAGFNGTDVYTYYDGAYYRLHMPGGRQAFVAAPDTAQVQFLGANPQTPFTPAVDNDLANKKYVDGAISGSTTFLKLAGGTMTGTIVAPTTVNTMTWAGTYNIFGSSGGWAVRSGTTNLLLATTTTVSAAVIFEVKASGAAIRFGSAGPTVTNVSGVVSISANVESTTAAPTAASHLTRKDYVDNNFAPKVAFDAALAEIQSLRTELAAMKAMLPAPAQPVSKSLPPLPPKPTKSTKPPKKGRRR